MSVTEQDIKRLTPEHRIVWKTPNAPHEVEMGLWNSEGTLYTDTGQIVRWETGDVSAYTQRRIVRIIEPAFTPRVGMAIGHPDRADDNWWLVCFEPDKWGGSAGLIAGVWLFTDDEVRNLVENHGWKVMDEASEEGGKK